MLENRNTLTVTGAFKADTRWCCGPAAWYIKLRPGQSLGILGVKARALPS